MSGAAWGGEDPPLRNHGSLWARPPWDLGVVHRGNRRLATDGVTILTNPPEQGAFGMRKSLLETREAHPRRAPAVPTAQAQAQSAPCYPL